jgi:hypothetical protein
MIVAIDNVIQNPSSAFNVSGSSITFTSAPLSGTNNIWVEYTSLITTYAGISQDPSVIGDITATGGYLSTGDFGNSFIDGTLIDYVTGAGRFTVGELDNLIFYHGGTSGRSEMMKLSYAGASTLEGGLTATGAGSFQGVTVGKGGGAVATNTAVGVNALVTNSAGAYLTAVGAQSARYTTGDGITAIGYAALNSNTSGTNNVAIGAFSLTANTTASENTAVGYQAGYTNVTGTQNTFIGVNAGRTSAVSGEARNVAVGYGAGYGLTTGTYNTFVGPTSGQEVTTGSRNTIIGNYSGNQGNLDIRTGSNYIVLSDGAGNPNASCNDSLWSLGMGTKNNDGLVAFQAISGANFGPVLIGRTGTLNSTTTRWYVGSNSWIKGGTAYDTLTCAAGAAASGGVQLSSGATSWASASDERLKNVTGTYTNALADIAQLKPVKFTWKSDTENKPQVGVLAQSVEKVVPEAVDHIRVDKEDETEYLGVRYTELVPLLIASIQEQQALITSLTARIEALESK